MSLAALIREDQLVLVRAHHDGDGGCCQHSTASSDTACCVCDAEAPCQPVIDATLDWHDEQGHEFDEVGDCICGVQDQGCDDCRAPLSRMCHCDALYEAAKERRLFG